MHICLNGITLVLDENHVDTLVNALAEKLLPRLEENWSRYLQTQLAELTGQVSTLEVKQEELLTAVGKLESDYQDLESRLDESDNKLEDMLTNDDIDVDEVNNTVSKLEDFDVDEVKDKLEELETKVNQMDSKAIIAKIAKVLLESTTVMA